MRLLRYSFLIVLLCSACAKRESAPIGPVLGTVESRDGTTIAYEVSGQGEPVLVFVHGWSCDRGYWKQQVDYFDGRYKTISIDLAGHGFSGLGRTDWSMENFGEDVAAVVRDLDLRNVILVGHSMGGAVIIEAAERLPGRVLALVAVDSLHDVEQEMSEDEIRDFIMPMRLDFQKGVQNMVTGFLFRADADPELMTRVAADMAKAPPESAIACMEELFRYKAAPNMDELALPIRSINCDMFPMNDAAGRRHAPSFVPTVIPGTGHFLMMEAPETFNRKLEEIVQDVWQVSGI